MTMLIIGLVLFLGLHSLRIFAEPWRVKTIARVGEGAWKGVYSVASLVGFGLLVWGYGLSRATPVELWNPPIWTKHLAALLMLVSMVLLAAAYVPGNRLKARLGHPMVLGTKTWALAHLLSNGRLADVILFGAFLVWAVLNFRAARARDRMAGASVSPSGAATASAARDGLTVLVGVVAWVAFAFGLHAWLIGVRPFG